MKKLMILAVAMVAMVVGGNAEAALRLVVHQTSDGLSTTNDLVYYIEAMNGSVAVNAGFMSGFDTTFTGLSTNNPGSANLGTVSQTWTLDSIAGSSVVLPAFTATLSVINSVASFDNSSLNVIKSLLPSSGFLVTDDVGLGYADRTTVLAQLETEFNTPQGLANISNSVSSTNSSTAGGNPDVIISGSAVGSASIYITGQGTYGPFATGAVSLNDPGHNGSSVSTLPVSIATTYMLRDTLSISAISAADGTDIHGVVVSLNTTVRAVVPEPTSLALAGFAGIGMAVGAIRRRRQAKQAA